MSLIKIENLSIKTPSGKTLTRGVSFEVSQNESLSLQEWVRMDFECSQASWEHSWRFRKVVGIKQK